MHEVNVDAILHTFSEAFVCGIATVAVWIVLSEIVIKMGIAQREDFEKFERFFKIFLPKFLK